MSEEEGGEKTETAVDLYREAPIMTRDHGNTMTMSEFAGWMEDNLGTDFQSALQQAAFMLCGDVISQDIAKSTLRLHRRTGSKTSEVVMPKEHPTAALLALEPNRRHTWMEYTEMMVYWGIVVSNAYAYVERDRVGNPIELIPLQSPRVEEKIEGRDVFYDIIASTEQERALLGATMLTAPERNMIHVRSRMLDGMNGYSTLSAGTNTLKAGKALDKFRENLFDGDGSLRGVFVRDTPSEMSEPAFQRLKSEFRSLMRNFRKLTEPIVLEGDFKFESISSNPKEMELTEQFTAQIKATCRLLRVPPYKVFELDGAKYDNLETSEKMYVGDSLIPTCKLHEERMAKVLLSKKDRLEYFFEYDREEMTLRDPARQTERAVRALERGGVDYDEFRAMLGLNPLSNGMGKARIIPTNMTMIDENGNVLIPGSSTASPGGDQNSSKSADELTDQTDDENSAQVLRLVANDER